MSLREENDALRVKVAALAEIAFGGSERRGGKGRDSGEGLGDLGDDCSGGEGGLGEAPEPVADDATGADGGGSGLSGRKRHRGQCRGARGHGRRRYDHLEVRVVVHDLGDDERCCGSCGQPYVQIGGDEVSSEISWRVVVYRIEHRRRRYRRACDCVGSAVIKVAPVPAKVVPKGLFSALAIASVLVEKFGLARPVNKVIASLSMNGFELYVHPALHKSNLSSVLAGEPIVLAGTHAKVRHAGYLKRPTSQ